MPHLRFPAALLLLTCSVMAFAQAVPPVFTEDVRETARLLAERALASDLAYGITRDLTTQVGPRLAGTEQEARARDWAVGTLEELGFANVRVEPFPLSLWTRGESVHEEAAIVARPRRFRTPADRLLRQLRRSAGVRNRRGRAGGQGGVRQRPHDRDPDR